MSEAHTRDTELNEAMTRAINLVTDALATLDEVGAPADIGAHLDLALHRMRRVHIKG